MSKELHMSQVLAILGVSLYVLGFGLGPLLFAPLGELYGRASVPKHRLAQYLRILQRIVFVITGSIFTLFHLGGALGHNAATILVTRLFAGTFGSARRLSCQMSHSTALIVDTVALTNAGGALSDMWIPRERGFASSLYSTAPWMGPGKCSSTSRSATSLTRKVSARTDRGRLGLGDATGMAVLLLDHVHCVSAERTRLYIHHSRDCKQTCFAS